MNEEERSEYLDAWRKFKDEHPYAYSAAAVLPVTGQVAAVADYADAMDRGDTVDGMIASASFIPGFKLGKMAAGKLAPPSLRLKSQMNTVERAIAPATKNSHHIGRAADAQQIGEQFVKEADAAEDRVKKSEPSRSSRLTDDEREEFSRMFNSKKDATPSIEVQQ